MQEMKTFYAFLILIVLFLSGCNNTPKTATENKSEIIGDWQYAIDGDTVLYQLNAEGGYKMTEVKTAKTTSGILIDSGSYKNLSNNIYELSPFLIIKDSVNQPLTSKYLYKITLLTTDSAVFTPGQYMSRTDGNSKQLQNSTFESVILQSEYNYKFTRYIFKQDSLLRYVGYSQTEEIDDSKLRPDLPFSISISDSAFFTIRTGPDKKIHKQEYSYDLSDDKLFFGKKSESKTFKRLK